MRRYLYGLLCLSLAFLSTHCTVRTGTATTAGQYSYFSRGLEVLYGMPLSEIWLRTGSALDTLQLTIISRRVDALGGVIRAQRADGTPITVWLDAATERNTLVGVRVGWWGSRALSERIHGAIRKQIGI